ncbi:MAG TPA: hypothetical protein VGE97_08030 [Nitrososphaera sp.]
MIIGTFILDFQSVDFEQDAKIIVDMLTGYQSLCKLENSFALDPPVRSLGWFFAKLFLAGELVETINAQEASNIETSRGKKFENKFISWLQNELKDKGCRAQIKLAAEMKSI